MRMGIEPKPLLVEQLERMGLVFVKFMPCSLLFCGPRGIVGYNRYCVYAVN